MHCCTFLITKNILSDDEIDQILDPFYYERKDENHVFTYDWAVVGGRYNGLLKLKTFCTSIDYEFNFICRTDRVGRLFRSCVLEDIRRTKNLAREPYREESYFGTLGRWDGYICVDGCYLKDLYNFDEVAEDHGCRLIDATSDMTVVYDREKDKDYDKIVEEILEKRRDENCFITVLDIHN